MSSVQDGAAFRGTLICPNSNTTLQNKLVQRNYLVQQYLLVEPGRPINLVLLLNMTAPTSPDQPDRRPAGKYSRADLHLASLGCSQI